MKKPSYQVQLILCLVFQLLCTVLAHVTKLGYLTNIGWIVFGLVFLLHPVWPKAWDWRDHKQLTRGTRIGGILVIIVGLITRFGV